MRPKQWIFYGFDGGYSRSRRAVEAEYEGRLPLHRASQVVRQKYGCTLEVAKTALKLLWDGEWHHVGPYLKSVDYYDTTDSRLPGTIQHITKCGGAKAWKDRRQKLRTERERTQLELCQCRYLPVRRELCVRRHYVNLRKLAREGNARAQELLQYFLQSLEEAKQHDSQRYPS